MHKTVMVASQNRMTPAQIARAWAQAHREFTGEINVASDTRKGKGGWGAARRHNRFFAEGGRVAADRENHRAEPRVWNGLCQVCGTVYLEQVLKRAWASDPQAGQPADIPEAAHIDLRHWPGWRKVIAADAHVAACPRCIEERGLRLESANGRSFDQDSKTHFVDRTHPELARFRDIDRRVSLTSVDAGGEGTATC